MITGSLINMNANNIPVSVALRSLTPSIKWGVVDDYDISTIEWRDEDNVQPTTEEIELVRQQMADAQNAIEYIKLRTEGQYQSIVDESGETTQQKTANGYPSIAHQLDLLYHDIKTGNLENGSWIAAIEAVKTQFPKPE